MATRSRVFPLGWRGRSRLFEPLAAALEAGDWAAVEAFRRALKEHPDAFAAELISEALEAAHLDPLVAYGSPVLSRIVMLMRELILDFVPGMTVEEGLEPLQILLSRHGGGRRPKLKTYEGWAARLEEFKRIRRGVGIAALQADIAAEWNAKHPQSKPITASAVRRGISEYQKSLKKGVS